MGKAVRVPVAAGLAAFAALAVGLALGALPPRDQRPLQALETGQPTPRGYVSSRECRSCHAQQYASWHASYHRTMTQVVTPETVIAAFDGVTLEWRGHRYHLSQEDGSFWAEMPDPDALDALANAPSAASPSEIPRVRRRIVQSTGSHHYQLYWYPTGRGRELYMLPFAFLKEEGRWAPRLSVFLTPPEGAQERLVWNHHCLPCHSTDGRPGYRAQPEGDAGRPAPESEVAELGIACEACHGPGLDHVRFRQGQPGAEPASMTHPRRVPAVRSAQICGQCHSVNTPYDYRGWIDWLLDGAQYRAGDDLTATRYLVNRRTLSLSPLMTAWIQQKPQSLDEWFWRDGHVRVTGRELNALMESPCYRGGEFSCVSCHSIHSGSQDDYLLPGMRGDAACLQCHNEYEENVEAHTHHPLASSGSRCQNCHMPNTVYGLLKASRSHTVSSPSVEATLKYARPNACNLCHLDRTLAWTAGRLEEWYGTPQPEFPAPRREVAAAVLDLLTGDAGLRALAAWHLGWKPAQEASGNDWIAPVLAATLEDPYDAVRYIAGRSLRTLPGFDDFPYDFLAPSDGRAAAAKDAVARWRSRGEVIERPGVPLDEETIRRLLEDRDDRPVRLAE